MAAVALLQPFDIVVLLPAGGVGQLYVVEAEAPARRMQLVFGVQGAKHDGVVSLEAHKRGTKIWFDMLSLDVRGSKQHMFLKGDKDRPLFPEIAEVLGGLRK